MSLLLTQKSTAYDVEIIKNLSEFNFKEADRLFYVHLEGGIINTGILDAYEDFRKPYVEKFFLEHIRLPNKFDEQQLSAISSICKNTLVSARAGSGKTKVIAGKIAFSILGEGVSPDEILTLSFNKKAAFEISERLIKEKEGFNIKDYNFSQTFHGLSYAIVKPKLEVLIDIEKFEDPKTGISIEYASKKQQKFIQRAFLSEFSKVRKYFENELSDEFRDMKRDGIHLDDEEFYKHRIASKFAFTGNYVRSKGEKYLLDFLVEYGFSDIKYEPIVQINGKIKKPDILCKIDGIGKPIYIEHWGSDSDWNLKVPDHWGIDGKAQYDLNKIEKQNYFKEKEKKGELIFIETNISNISYGDNERDLFFIFLKELFEKRLGIELKRKNLAEVVEMVRLNNHYIYPVVKKIQQYIQKAQFQRKDPESMRKFIIEYSCGKKLDARTQAFLIIANIIYRKYEENKIIQNAMDFNQLIEMAIKKIQNHKGNININLKDGVINIKNLKYILIDEYQDFSPLFYALIRTIKDYNPTFKLFVVGDDWQAINSFAGSEIRFFIDFLSTFEGEATTKKNISTNYRSSKNIVEGGNLLMRRTGGERSTAFSEDYGSKIHLFDITKHIECRFDTDIINNIFPFKEKDNKKSASIGMKKNVFKGILKIINQAIREEKNILVLARNNIVYSESLGDWKLKIEQYYQQLIKKQDILYSVKEEKLKKLGKRFLSGEIEFLTCHKSKGKQADRVIILDASKKNFPASEEDLRNDKNYFGIFDDTTENILMNERKLFYVALTRAKEEQFIFYDPKKETSLLSELKTLIEINSIRVPE